MSTREDTNNTLAAIVMQHMGDAAAIHNAVFEAAPKFKLREDRPILFCWMEYPVDDLAAYERMENELFLAHRFAEEDSLIVEPGTEPARKRGPKARLPPIPTEYHEWHAKWKEAVKRRRDMLLEYDRYVAHCKSEMARLKNR